MNKIWVCPQRHLVNTLELSQASAVISLSSPKSEIIRPKLISGDKFLSIQFHDISQARDGLELATREQIETLIDFGRDQLAAGSVVIHCFAGISRSPAAAFLLKCCVCPFETEEFWALHMRSLCKKVTPNRHVVELADQILQREGRMVKAIDGIGRGADAFEGNVFCL
ncbi:tyrosine phosphatase family protein [Polycladidibacter stylochi]|uniref:tyrosine phosphatase family protein n=1 Tax=Polycladidibacter stylochi TaxID=1807766 RepID=UPI00082D470B|nr:dual specificity protein phosphatase family protein [Pseudovibrio stylochi]